MCTTIVSILENTARTCSMYILDGGILPDTRLQIQGMAQRYPHLHKIEFIGIDIERFANFPNLMHFSLNTYFRYLIPELKPELQKALYIDSDMVITADVGKLFDTVSYLLQFHDPPDKFLKFFKFLHNIHSRETNEPSSP